MAQVMNGRLQTPQGAPKSLIFDLPSSMINATKIENRIQPYGQATFTTPGQIAKFVIPKTDRALINPQTMYITGNVATTGYAGTAGTDVCFILGTYYSMFVRQVVSSNGKVLETIERPGQLVNMLYNMTLNPAEKKGLANSLGFYNDIISGEADVTGNYCQAMFTSATGAVNNFTNGGINFTFAIPLVGLLNCAKFIPLWNGDISVELTLDNPINYLISATATGAAGLSGVSVTMTGLELVVDQLNLTPESYAMVMQAYPEKLYIKSQSYDFGSASISGSGAVDIPVNIKRSSLKQVFTYFSDASGVDKAYGGVNPNGTDLVFITNGTQYPQRPLKLTNPSEMYNQVQKAFGALYSAGHSGAMGRSEFCRRMTGNDNYLVTSTTVTDAPQLSNKFYIAIDTELINYDSDSLYSGIPMGVNSNFRLNIGTALPRGCTNYFWMCYDAVIEMDLINGITSVIA